MTQQRLQLTWYNKDKALIPTETGKYGYRWVEPSDPRYCETHTLVMDEYIRGEQSPKSDEYQYSEYADLEPQTDNLLVHGESGDVLEALTRVPELAEKYVGNVKLVYIDPPFNTAQTFDSYEDNLEHSIWLTMMRDRLLHLKRLLSDDGSIWVHLDDKEDHRMRVLLDEIFGAGNFVTEVIWQKADSPRNDAKYFSSDHDIIVVYAKSEAFKVNGLPRTVADNARFSNPDNDPKGPWWDGDPTANDARFHQGMVYAIQQPITGELIYPARARHWAFDQSKILEIVNGWAPYKLEILDDTDARAELCGISPEEVRRDVPALVLAVPLNEAKEQAEEIYEGGNWPVFILRSGGEGRFGKKSYIPNRLNVPRTLWPNAEVGHNRTSKSEIKALFPGKTPFSTPKPEALLKRIIHIGSKPGDIVLDCFAGSGTTAAVAQKMGRRWVTCELLDSTFRDFTLPRLEKVVYGTDEGGVSRSEGERFDDSPEGLPDKMTPEDANQFTSWLNKLISNDDALKTSSDVKKLKQLAKTKKSKMLVNWRGGGGFQVAHLSKECFDYDDSLGRVMLTEAATGDTLVKSIAANLGFRTIPDSCTSPFDAHRGDTYLKVVEGIIDADTVDSIVGKLGEGEKIVIAGTMVMDGAREHLRKISKGSRVIAVPDDVFRYTKGGAR